MKEEKTWENDSLNNGEFLAILEKIQRFNRKTERDNKKKQERVRESKKKQEKTRESKRNDGHGRDNREIIL